MDLSRWDAPRPELLDDADTVSFEPRTRFGGRRRPRWLIPVVTFALGAGAGSGAAYAVLADPAPSVRQPVPTTTTVNHEVMLPAQVRVAPFQPWPDPVDPKVTYRAWCDAEMRPAGSAGASGRFVASVQFANMGNVGTTYLVTATWQVAGGVRVMRSTTRPVSAGTRARATIVVPVTSAEVTANRAMTSADRCSTLVTLQSFYRDPTG